MKSSSCQESCSEERWGTQSPEWGGGIELDVRQMCRQTLIPPKKYLMNTCHELDTCELVSKIKMIAFKADHMMF